MAHFVDKKMNKGGLVKQRNTGSPNELTRTFWHRAILFLVFNFLFGPGSFKDFCNKIFKNPDCTNNE